MLATDDMASPFGHPDGAREDFANLITFGDATAGGIATRPDDPSARIVVGRKGSGKTYFLRRVHDAMRRENTYVSDVYEAPPATELVMEFSRRSQNDGRAVEKWSVLWKCAILTSVLSHVSRVPRLRTHCISETSQAIEKEFGQFFATPSRPVDICAQAQHLIALMLRRKRSNVDRLSEANLANSLRSALKEHIRDLPPLFFFIDGIDDYFDRAPHDWMLCQLGLLEALKQLLIDSHLGGRLHVTVSLRDVVWSAACSSEHAARRQDETYVRFLHWSKKTSVNFITSKLEHLHHRWFLDLEGAGRTCRGWLGHAKVPNLKYGFEEEIEEYLLRHTRLLPRDVVVLGNDLCRSLIKLQSRDSPYVLSRIRETVSRCAHIFGEEQVRTCATEFISRMVPEGLNNPEMYSAYLDNPHLLDDVTTSIRKLLQSEVRTTRFTSKTLLGARRKWSETAKSTYDNEDCDIFEILWRNQLLGYQNIVAGESRDEFFDERKVGEKLPDADHYLLHPILREAAEIVANGERPVLPWVE